MDDHQQIEEIIREIAAKHGVAVARDDPILILQTINNRLLLDSAKAQQALLDKHKQELEALALQWGNDAKERAERILTVALAASRDTMLAISEQTAKTTSAALTADIEVALAGLRQPIQEARRIAILNVIAACITMGAACIAFWVVLQ